MADGADCEGRVQALVEAEQREFDGIEDVGKRVRLGNVFSRSMNRRVGQS
jgi:hypothetical protein